MHNFIFVLSLYLSMFIVKMLPSVTLCSSTCQKRHQHPETTEMLQQSMCENYTIVKKTVYKAIDLIGLWSFVKCVY